MKADTVNCSSNISDKVIPGNGVASRRMLYWMLILFCFNVPMLWLNDFPCDDVASRYAPMAEAFARGDWHYAFHPRFGWFFSVFSGSISFLTDLDGFRACQLASLIMYTLAAWPLFRIFQSIWNDTVAFRGAMMYLFCSHLFRLAIEGLRDSGKTLGFALAAYGLVLLFRSAANRRGYGCLALGSVIMIWSRGDGLFNAFFMSLMAFYFEIRELRCFPRRSMVMLLLIGMLLLPQIGYNLYTLGYPVPESRMAVMLKKMNFQPWFEPKAVMP